MTTEQLLALALEALSFYANEENWVRPLHSYSSAEMPSETMKDSGSKAREALEAIKNLEEV